MSRLSRSQTQRRAAQSTSSRTHSSVSRFNSHRCPVITKETLHKRVSLSGIQTRESSLFGEAAFSLSEPIGEKKDQISKKHEPRTAGKDLLTAAHAVFPARQRLYSVDCFGRRSEIETRYMSDASYLSLLEAFKNPVRLDSPTDLGLACSSIDVPHEIPEGCKMGIETELPIPDWWEVPEEGITTEEGAMSEEGEATTDTQGMIDMPAMIRRNLERAKREGRGIFPRGLNGLGGGLTTFGGAR
jgi:hypothetical protein